MRRAARTVALHGLQVSGPFALYALSKLVGLGFKLRIAQVLDLRLERIDLIHDLPILLNVALVIVEEFSEPVHGVVILGV